MIKQIILREKLSKSAQFTPLLFFKEKGLGDEFFISNATALDLLEEVFQGNQAPTKINRNVRKVIFSQIATIIAEKD
ncbi:hypothetical protein ACX8XP_04370 [Calditrichota bacterium LG25]